MGVFSYFALGSGGGALGGAGGVAIIATPKETAYRNKKDGLELLGFLPTRLGGLFGHFPPFFAGHGSQATLAAYLPSSTTHFCHHAGNFGCVGRKRRYDWSLWLGFGSRELNQIVSKLIYIFRSGSPAKSLWHGLSMTRLQNPSRPKKFKVAHYQTPPGISVLYWAA